MMSIRMMFLTEGLLYLGFQKGMISQKQYVATSAYSTAYATRAEWGPTAAHVFGRALGYGSKPLPAITPRVAVAAHPGTLGISLPRGSTIARGFGRALGWASVIWTFATLEQPGTTSTGSFRD